MINPVAVWQYLCARFNLGRRGDEGLVTTEVAVIVFLLVAGAILVVGILVAAAQDNANNVPVPEAP
jgi:hypothetical protein